MPEMSTYPAAQCVETPTRSHRVMASLHYPSTLLISGQRLHIFPMDGRWEVWLNTEISDFDGLCMGVGDTRHEALVDFVSRLAEALHAGTDALSIPDSVAHSLVAAEHSTAGSDMTDDAGHV
jgi:hypothetical protein